MLSQFQVIAIVVPEEVRYLFRCLCLHIEITSDGKFLNKHFKMFRQIFVKLIKNHSPKSRIRIRLGCSFLLESLQSWWHIE